MTYRHSFLQKQLYTNALREAVISEIGRQNAKHITSTMEKLDDTASCLATISVILAFLGVILAVMQVMQAID
jgi:hypothetical protein